MPGIKYFNDLPQEEKDLFKKIFLKALNDLSNLKYPFETTTIGGEKLTILGPADWFDPYKSERIKRNTKIDFSQLMAVDESNKKSIRMAVQVMDPWTGRRLLPTSGLPLKPGPFKNLLIKQLKKGEKNETINQRTRNGLSEALCNRRSAD